jgi:hypothetical protein
MVDYKFKYYLNLLSFIVFLSVFLIGVLKLPALTPLTVNLNLPWLQMSLIHHWGGVLLGVLITIHLIIHYDWIKQNTKKVFKK